MVDPDGCFAVLLFDMESRFADNGLSLLLSVRLGFLRYFAKISSEDSLRAINKVTIYNCNDTNY